MGSPLVMPQARHPKLGAELVYPGRCSPSTMPTPVGSAPNTFALKVLRRTFVGKQTEERSQIGRLPPRLVNFSHQTSFPQRYSERCRPSGLVRNHPVPLVKKRVFGMTPPKSARYSRPPD